MGSVGEGNKGNKTLVMRWVGEGNKGNKTSVGVGNKTLVIGLVGEGNKTFLVKLLITVRLFKSYID